MDLKYCKDLRQLFRNQDATDIEGETDKDKKGKLGSLILIILLILFVFSTAEAATCTYTISPTNQSFSSYGDTDSISVTTQSGCSWTATKSLDWVSITSGSSGTGSGTVTYSVSANSTGQPRKGTITIGNQNFTIRQAKSVFNDVTDPTYWAYPYIYAIYTEGITVGCGNNNYCPYDSVTRGQMAAFIIRAKYGEDFTYTQTPYFSDVPPTHVFFKYVQKLKDEGITAVTGSYGVDSDVTRGQMAAFIIRALYGETFTYTTTHYFSDVPSNHTFFKYVQKLKDEGITAVTGTYDVDSVVSREQMAAFISRAFLRDISMITPYISESDVAYIHDAFSSADNAPWGFIHNGIDFSPSGNLKPFRAVSSGVIKELRLFQNNVTSNWQVNVGIQYNTIYTVYYAFEPMTTVRADGETQMANIFVSQEQSVFQGDIIGKLHTAGWGAHVHFGLYRYLPNGGDYAICPESYFTPEARESILTLIRREYPGANMCY
jgi:hypothetical protein